MPAFPTHKSGSESARTAHRSVATLLTMLLAYVAMGCGQTNGAAIDEMRPAFQARRQQWAMLASQLPPPGTVGLSLVPLNPPLVLNEGNESQSNVEVVMFDTLQDPDSTRPAQSNRLDLNLGGAIERCMAWTGANNPMSETAMRNRDGKRLKSECMAALARPYLLVLRAANYVQPVVTSTSSYTPAYAVLEGFIVDAATNTLRGTFVVSARSDANVQYSYRRESQREVVTRRTSRFGSTTSRRTEIVPGEDPLARLRAAAHSSLWVNARQAVAHALTATGATVTLD
jgi:hypothetical protein